MVWAQDLNVIAQNSQNGRLRKVTVVPCILERVQRIVYFLPEDIFSFFFHSSEGLFFCTLAW